MAKREALLKAAESKVRAGGYNNFSFRELASEVGIKSASVHYHFPTKADLGAELAKQYTDMFMTALGDPNTLLKSGHDPIKAYVQCFQHALMSDKKMCLCGLLGAETDSLPDKVRYETKRFFERNLDWLEQAYRAKGQDDPDITRRLAARTLSVLEGAMMISISLNDPEIFLSAVAEV